jgi:phosphonoacetate hydrolase
LHGISGNFYFDARSRQAVMMNDASFLRADTILETFSDQGAVVVAVTAKHKLKQLLNIGAGGRCLSAEEQGQPVYSAQLSEHVFRRGVELIRLLKPDLVYLSTSDYVQHACAPGTAEANRFYAMVDEYLGILNDMGVTLVITADHGMSAKTGACGRPRILFLQDRLDDWFGEHRATVILPITDPYVAHHAALGSFATIYVVDRVHVPVCISRLGRLSGVELVLERADAAAAFELPDDRIGDIVVCGGRNTVLGRRRREHDLSVLNGPLRSHGGLAEREVPMFFNRQPVDPPAPLKNYDAFWLGLNGLRDD